MYRHPLGKCEPRHGGAVVGPRLSAHVLVLSRSCVEAPIVVGVLEQLADDERAVFTGVLDDLPGRNLDGATHDIDAGLLICIRSFETIERLQRAQKRHAASGQDTLLDRGARCVHCIVDAILFLFDFDLGGTADADYGDAASEFRQTLLQLLPIVVGGGLLDLRLDLGDAGLDVLLGACAVDDGRVLLVDDDLLGAPEHARA